MAKANEGKRELILTRVLDAPRELVWKAWTDPGLMSKWWGPKGVTTPTCDIDLRQGGPIYIVMLAGKELGSFAGQEWPMSGTFVEIAPPERLVYTAAALDGKKGVLLETRTTLTLETLDEKTRMTLKIAVTKLSPGGEFALAGMEMGWNQSLDKLADFLAK
jgi:uncharacterized protein YndB with AHSA1/START domain